MAECKWCGNTDGCDCIERMTCPKAGVIGHTSCGTQSCGCPVFIGDCEGDCKEIKSLPSVLNRAGWGGIL